MLSRIAESLFWIGRYVERADDTARILDAYVHRILEDPWTDEVAACRSLLDILGVKAPGEVGRHRDRPGCCSPSTAAAPARSSARWSAARENARGARETISAELWEALNATWAPARRSAARAAAAARTASSASSGTGRRPSAGWPTPP